jgi:hypothetical protein
MIEIKDLLGRFTNLLVSGEGKKEAVREAISEVIKIKIDSRDIRIKDGTIYLNVKPIYRSEIFLKEEQIFSKLKEIFGANPPKNIR